MSERLTPAGGGGGAGRLLRHAAFALIGAVAWGAVLGVLWEWVWTPPSGAAWKGEWYLDPTGMTMDVAATGWFTALGLLGGLAYGLVTSWFSPRRELLTLGLVLLGSVLAAWVMFHVGHLVGPPDPHEVARAAGDLEPIPGDLRLAGASLRPWPLWFESGAFTALPGGAMMGVIGVFLGSQRSAKPRSSGARDASVR